MKLKYFIISLFITSVQGVMAQGWVKKVKGSVIKITTFKADGSIIGSTNGFITDGEGNAVTTYSPFKGAYKAVAFDSDGKEHAVDMIIGANDIYDVIKIHVKDMDDAVKIAKDPASNGKKLYIMHYSTSHVNPRYGNITKTEKFRDKYTYYSFSADAVENSNGSPVLNENGEVVGILQSSSSSKECYAVDANFANDLTTNGLSASDPTLTAIGIEKSLPEKLEDAKVMLFMSSSLGLSQHEKVVNKFISRFPNQPDGYLAMADIDYEKNDFAAVEKDIDKAMQLSDKKDNEHSTLAKYIYSKCVYKPNIDYPSWTLQKALDEVETANSINHQPFYIFQKAEILYAMQKYRNSTHAFNEYKSLMGDNVDDAFYFARYQAEVKSKLYQQALNDIDSAIVKNSRNIIYHTEKANLLYRVGKFDDAIKASQEALQIDSNNSVAYLVMGLAYINKKDKTQGLANLRKAQQLGNPQAEGFINKYK